MGIGTCLSITGSAPDLRVDGADCKPGAYKILAEKDYPNFSSCADVPLSTHEYEHSDGKVSYRLCLQKL